MISARRRDGSCGSHLFNPGHLSNNPRRNTMPDRPKKWRRRRPPRFSRRQRLVRKTLFALSTGVFTTPKTLTASSKTNSPIIAAWRSVRSTAREDSPFLCGVPAADGTAPSADPCAVVPSHQTRSRRRLFVSHGTSQEHTTIRLGVARQVISLFRADVREPPRATKSLWLTRFGASHHPRRDLLSPLPSCSLP